MSPQSLANRLLTIYMTISNARQSLELINIRQQPKDSQCARVHDVIRITSEQTLKECAEDIAEIVHDLKSWEYMQLKDQSPDGATGWNEK